MKIKNKIVKDFKKTPIDELAEAPVYAFYGITGRNALTLYKALKIETIRDLANLSLVKWAREISADAEKNSHTLSPHIKEHLMKEYHNSTPEKIANGPTYALYGLSKKSVKLLKKDFSIHTVKDLAEFKYVKWAQNIDYKQKLIKDYENYPVSELLEAPVFALQGVSKKDAKLFKQAFNVETIQDLAKLKFITWANEILNLYKSGSPDPDMSSFENKIIKRYENKPPEKLIKAPLHALQGVSKKEGDLMYDAFKIKTIEKFAELKYAKWARGLVGLHNSAIDTSDIQTEDENKTFRNFLVLIVILLSAGAFFFYNKFNQKNNTEKRTAEEKIISQKTEKIVEIEKVSKKDNSALKLTESDSNSMKNSYIVKWGDTLVTISEAKFGTYKKWEPIYKLNKKTISKPWKIYPGQRIELPVFKK